MEDLELVVKVVLLMLVPHQNHHLEELKLFTVVVPEIVMAGNRVEEVEAA
jgi:hypothetical protein